MALVQASLAQVAQGQGQVLGILGEPGMGKSRLLAEFWQHLAGQAVTYYAGQCLPYGQATPYLPLRDVVRQHCGLGATDPPEAVTAAVHRCMQETGLRPEEAAAVLLQLLERPVAEVAFTQRSPEERRALTFRVLHQLCQSVSQRQPLVLAVEDVHWIDATSEAWLATLVARLAGTPLLLLVTYRPGYQPPWLGQSHATQVALPRLTPQESLLVVQGVLQTAPVPAAVGHAIVTKAAGNPFFLEELSWTARTSGPAHAALTLPTTIQAVLAARLDRLPPTEKRLVQTAAVIGPEVPVPLLQAVTDVAPDALPHLLGCLQAAEVLYETSLVPVPVYTFKHVLTQEVAYGSLLQDQRRALHARIVEVIEALAGDRLAEQGERLAYHALRGEVWDKAVTYCQQAGARAYDRAAFHEAVASFDQALSALPHLPETRETREQAVDLRLTLRSALAQSGDHGRVLAALREAEALAATLDDSRRLGQVSRFLSARFFHMGMPDQALAFGERALALATAGGDVVLQALANQNLGFVYQAQGDYRRAIDCLGQVVTSLEGARRHERFGQVFLPAVCSCAWLAECHAELGTFAEGRALGDEGLRIAEAVAHPASLMIALWGIGLLALSQGDLPRALPRLERAAGICQDMFPRSFPRLAAALGATYTLSGRGADAVSLLTQALAQATATDPGWSQALCRLSLGEAQLLAGRLEEAQALAERTLALARTHQERGRQAYALRLFGDIAARRDPPESTSAEAHYQQALALAEALGMRPLQAHCHLGLGTLYAKSGQREQARTALATAIALYRAMEMMLWLPQAEAALAQVT
jgi:tetratricopeptide (TPR) repeat protein